MENSVQDGVYHLHKIPNLQHLTCDTDQNIISTGPETGGEWPVSGQNISHADIMVGKF